MQEQRRNRLSAFSELSRLSEDSGASTAGWPVYVSYPAFLWDSDDETDCRLHSLQLTDLPPQPGRLLRRHCPQGPPVPAGPCLFFSFLPGETMLE